MLGSNTDRVWERYGRADPYFGVFSDPRFRNAARPGSAREEFFRSGENYIDSVLTTAHALFPQAAPERGLDFGCGVGRLVIPLAQRLRRVVGVDISESMIAEARRNCSAAGQDNVNFVVADDHLTRLEGQFDLIHSFIVFQHIPVKRGLRLFAGLLDRLADQGIGIVHFTFANTNTRLRRGIYQVRKWVPAAHWLLEVAHRRQPGPHMQLNRYPLNTLFAMLQKAGCHEVSVRYSDHGGHYGALLFFRRVRLTPY